MTTLEGRLKDKGYRNWVKSALCLQYTRDGLMTFTGLKSLELNQTIIRQLRLRKNPSVYNLCSKITFNMRNKSISCCTNCNDILTEVMKYQPWRLDLNLRNSDPKQLLHQHWQCAKLYMNPGQVVNSAGPKDTDISGLLNFIDHCTVPRGYVNNPHNIKQVRDTRNRVLHTSSMHITNDDFQKTITPLLLDLLKDPGFLLTDLDAIAAVEKINEVKKADFVITQDNERKVIDELANEIHQMNLLTNERVDTLRNDVTALKSSNQEEFTKLRDDMIKKNNVEMSKARNMLEILRKKIEQSSDMRDKVAHQQIQNLQEQTKNTDESIKTLQLSIGDNKRRLSDQQGQIKYLNEEQTKLKEDQKEDRKDINDLFERHKKFEKGLDEGKGENETLTPSNEEKSDLRKYLIDGYKEKLEVTLLPEWIQLPVSEIFTPSILVCDEGNKTHKKEEFRNLETYRQLFYKNDVLQKRVILLGEAGTGKTTFSKHLTDAWCETTTKTQFADVDKLTQFRYLFYVSCRFAEEKETLLDMINIQLFKDGRMKEVALYMLLNYPEWCLIVLDGADEWKGSPTSETGRRGDITGLPGMTGVEGCVILITSRPWRFHALPTKAKDIFRRLEINGVKNVEELAFSILKKLKDPAPEESTKDFMHQVWKKNMLELMKIPFILIISLGGWIDSKSLHRSKTINYINMILSFIRRLEGQAGWPKDKLPQLSSELNNLKSEWEQQAHELPEFLLAYKSFKRYAGLFLSLGQLALSLLLEKEEQSLVFSKEVLKKYCPADEENDESVNVCLTLGILSKTETTTRGIKKLETYAFYHKTFQEFFAALWLTSKYSNEKSKLYGCIKSYRDLMSYEILITFLCGLNPEAGESFWMFVSEEVKLMREEELKNWYIGNERMERVTALACKCMKEHGCDPKSQKSDQIYFRIPHIGIHRYNSDEDMILIRHVIEKYPDNVKSLALERVTMTDLLLPLEGFRITSLKLVDVTMTHSDFDKLAGALLSYSGLEYLELYAVRCREHSDSCCIPVLDLQKQNKLKRLRLRNLSVAGLLLPVEGARMTLLQLKDVTMTHHYCEQLAEALLAYTGLEYLSLRDVRYREDDDACWITVLDLQKHNKLETLKLWSLSVEGLLLPVGRASITLLELVDVTMTHHGCEQLAGALFSCSGLEYLLLGKVRCREHSDSCCIPVLDLQNYIKLKRLRLQNLSVAGLLLPVEGARMTLLQLMDVTMTHHDCEQLAESLLFYSGLKYLELRKVRCREDDGACYIPVLDLRKHKLKRLLLCDLSVEWLLLPVEEASIRILDLSDVTMTHCGWESFLSRPELQKRRLFETDVMCSFSDLKCRKHRYSTCQTVEDIYNKRTKLSELMNTVTTFQR